MRWRTGVSAPSSARQRSTYVPGVTKAAVFDGEAGLPKDTGPGPLTTLQALVTSPVHNPHAARADQRRDLIRPEARSRGETHENLRALGVERSDGRIVAPGRAV